MKARQIKTIDLQVTEWFDKVNGNSYFSAKVTINYGLKNESSFVIPFQYGYGNHSEYVAFKEIQKRLNCMKQYASYWQAYEANNIVYRYSKRDTLKRNMY